MRFRFCGIFIDKITRVMLIILPVLILMATSIILVFLIFIKPGFRFHWLIAMLGALLSLFAVFLWQTKIPFTFSLTAWTPQALFLYSPSWLADEISWPFAVILATLGLATISTAVIGKQSTPWNWVSILFFVSIGLLMVSADNPLTLVIAWLALDITELATLLRTVKEVKSEELVVAFAIRLSGVFLLLWVSIVSISSGSPMNFREIPNGAGTLLLITGILRLGVFPLQLPIYDLEQRRGIITTLRLVSSASGLSLIARIPVTSFPSQLLPFLIMTSGIFAIISGWRWLRSSDELSGRPFLISGIGFLAITATLLGNNSGSVAWGICLILSGGLLFMNSIRGKRTYWLLILGLWGLSTLPFSLSSTAWNNPSNTNYLLLIPYFLGFSIIFTGYIRHAFTRPGDMDIELEHRWVQVVYPLGLGVLPIIGITISFMEWFQDRSFGLWWISFIPIILSTIIYFLITRINKSSILINLRYQPFKVNFFAIVFWGVYRFIRQIISLLTSILEGDGGMLWSIVILVLLISVISQALQFSQ